MEVLSARFLNKPKPRHQGSRPNCEVCRDAANNLRDVHAQRYAHIPGYMSVTGRENCRLRGGSSRSLAQGLRSKASPAKSLSAPPQLRAHDGAPHRRRHTAVPGGSRAARRSPWRRQPAAVTTESVRFKSVLKCTFRATFSRRAYFSKPRMYGTTGGRDPVLNSGPRVER